MARGPRCRWPGQGRRRVQTGEKVDGGKELAHLLVELGGLRQLDVDLLGKGEFGNGEAAHLLAPPLRWRAQLKAFSLW